MSEENWIEVGSPDSIEEEDTDDEMPELEEIMDDFNTETPGPIPLRRTSNVPYNYYRGPRINTTSFLTNMIRNELERQDEEDIQAAIMASLIQTTPTDTSNN